MFEATYLVCFRICFPRGLGWDFFRQNSSLLSCMLQGRSLPCTSDSETDYLHTYLLFPQGLSSMNTSGQPEPLFYYKRMLFYNRHLGAAKELLSRLPGTWWPLQYHLERCLFLGNLLTASLVVELLLCDALFIHQEEIFGCLLWALFPALPPVHYCSWRFHYQPHRWLE